MTEPDVTLRDVWQLLCSMDQSINERFDRMERRLVAFDRNVSAMALEIEAKVSALMGDE